MTLLFACVRVLLSLAILPCICCVVSCLLFCCFKFGVFMCVFVFYCLFVIASWCVFSFLTCCFLFVGDLWFEVSCVCLLSDGVSRFLVCFVFVVSYILSVVFCTVSEVLVE